jgi:hypothetical protein
MAMSAPAPAPGEPTTEKFNVACGECPNHGPRCTVLVFSSTGGTMSQVAHLNEGAVDRVHSILGQRRIALGVRG